MAEKCNLINVCWAAALGTSFMLFTGCYVLAGEGTLIIKAFHKGKHQRCILIHGPAGSDRIINAGCSQQELLWLVIGKFSLRCFISNLTQFAVTTRQILPIVLIYIKQKIAY